MNFYDITCEAACAVNLPAKTREDILKAIAGQATKAPGLSELTEEEIYQGLLTREKQGSTGFGKGIAQKFSSLGAQVIIADINVEPGEQTAAEIGLEEALNDQNNLVVIEWAERLPINQESLQIDFQTQGDEHVITLL